MSDPQVLAGMSKHLLFSEALEAESSSASVGVGVVEVGVVVIDHMWLAVHWNWPFLSP